jgi:hypothetical protein
MTPGCASTATTSSNLLTLTPCGSLSSIPSFAGSSSPMKVCAANSPKHSPSRSPFSQFGMSPSKPPPAFGGGDDSAKSSASVQTNAAAGPMTGMSAAASDAVSTSCRLFPRIFPSLQISVPSAGGDAGPQSLQSGRTDREGPSGSSSPTSAAGARGSKSYLQLDTSEKMFADSNPIRNRAGAGSAGETQGSKQTRAEATLRQQREAHNLQLAHDHWAVDAGRLPVHLTVLIPARTSWAGPVSEQAAEFFEGIFEIRPCSRLGFRNYVKLCQLPWFEACGLPSIEALESKQFEPFFKPGKRFMKVRLIFMLYLFILLLYFATRLSYLLFSYHSSLFSSPSQEVFQEQGDFREWQIDEEELLHRNRRSRNNRADTSSLSPRCTAEDPLSHFQYVAPQYRSARGKRSAAPEKNQQTSTSSSIGTSTGASIISAISATISGSSGRNAAQVHQHPQQDQVWSADAGTAGTAGTTSSSAHCMDQDPPPSQQQQPKQPAPSAAAGNRVKPQLPSLAAATSKKPVASFSSSSSNSIVGSGIVGSSSSSSGSSSSGKSRADTAADRLFGLSISSKKVFVGGTGSGGGGSVGKGGSAFSSVGWTGRATS